MTSIAALREPEPDRPGPAEYDPVASQFDSPRGAKGSPRGTVINPITVISPISPGRAAAAMRNPSLQKMSVPSIPSRFLTPIIDGNQDEGEANDVCKMSRLVDDPSKVGPGTYQIEEEQTKKVALGGINWLNSKSKRSGI